MPLDILKLQASIKHIFTKHKKSSSFIQSRPLSAAREDPLPVTFQPVPPIKILPRALDAEKQPSPSETFHEVLDIKPPIKHGFSSSSMHGRQQGTLVGSPHSYSRPTPQSSSTITLVGPRKVEIEDFDTVKMLGKGAFGSVYQVRDRTTRAHMALKVISKAGRSASACRAIIREQKTLRSMADSPWLLAMDASWHDSKNFYFLTNLYPTTLDSEIIRCGVIEKRRAQIYFTELLIAVRELHSRGIIHRDIKPANILLDHGGHIVLADVGLAQNFGQKPSVPEMMAQPYWPYLSDNVTPNSTPSHPRELLFVSNSICGSPCEMAPEVHRGDWYSFGVDFWSSAATLHWMVTGRPLFYHDDDNELRRMVLEDDIVFLPSDNLDWETQDILTAMLQKEPRDRLPMGLETETHPFFAGINWAQLENRTTPAPWVPEKSTYTASSNIEPLISGDSIPPELDPYPWFTFVSAHLNAGAMISSYWEDDDAKDQLESPVQLHKKKSLFNFFSRSKGASVTTGTHPGRPQHIEPKGLNPPIPAFATAAAPPISNSLIIKLKGFVQPVQLPNGHILVSEALVH